MRTINFNYRFLFTLGNNLNINENYNSKLIAFSKNTFIIFVLIFCAIISTIEYMKEYKDKMVEIFIAAYQIPVTIGSFLSYLWFSYYKGNVNENFHEINKIVEERTKLCDHNVELYDKSMKRFDRLYKLTTLIFFGAFILHSTSVLIINVAIYFNQENLQTENLYLPFRFK